MFNFIKSIIYEFLSYFVPQKIQYEITGECKKCGKCCNYMYSVDTYTEREFKIMQFLYPKYKRFYIKDENDSKNESENSEKPEKEQQRLRDLEEARRKAKKERIEKFRKLRAQIDSLQSEVAGLNMSDAELKEYDPNYKPNK